MKEKFRPGEQAPKTGDYACYDEQGRCGGTTHLEKRSKISSYTTLWKPLRTWKIKRLYHLKICRKLFFKLSAKKTLSIW